MDIDRLDSDLQFANQIGATLNIEEKNLMKLALLKFNESQNFEKIMFWGKIEGVISDYYIVVGLNFRSQPLFPLKKFFWASSGFIFAELPEANLQYKDYLESIRYLFTGVQQTLLSQLDEELNPDYKALPKTKLSELDRLSFVVNQIEEDCQVIPMGGVQMNPTKEFQYNQAFRGLTIYESQELQFYQHFRKQKSEEKQKQIERGDYLFKFDFLDSLDNDLPIGSWSIQSDNSKTMVTLRNLMWPGFIGYHRTNSNIFGGVYFGQGIKNIDLPFLL